MRLRLGPGGKGQTVEIFEAGGGKIGGKTQAADRRVGYRNAEKKIHPGGQGRAHGGGGGWRGGFEVTNPPNPLLRSTLEGERKRFLSNTSQRVKGTVPGTCEIEKRKNDEGD